jgi:hypothetical protein
MVQASQQEEVFTPTCLPALALRCLLPSPSIQALHCLPPPEHAVSNLGAMLWSDDSMINVMGYALTSEIPRQGTGTNKCNDVRVDGGCMKSVCLSCVGIHIALLL